MKYAIIDIETTGGSPRTEKITEIAIYIHDGKELIDEYATLINPERSIPPFITNLTGITNEMVANAPKFFEVAKDIVLKTEGAIFVAHNANFDYGFVKMEFNNLGFDYQRKTLDTIKLSRKLLPGHASYSLGKLCDDLGIVIEGRHRAAGDALATVQLFEIMLRNYEAFEQVADPEKFKLLKGIDREAHRALLNKLPEATGVYYLYDGDKNLIYIGKSNNIKLRVAQHLRNSGGRKAIEMREKIIDIDFEITGSELVALLLESDEIKKHKPLFNRAQKRSLFPFGLFYHYDLNGYLNLSIKKVTAKAGLPIAVFSNTDEAKKQIFHLIEKFGLCQKLCGQYKSDGACFHYGVNQCKGACIGEEEVDDYNGRIIDMIQSFEYEQQTFFIVDAGRNENEQALIQISEGQYCGFGYIPKGIENEEELCLSIKKYSNNRDVQQIIKTYLRQNKYEKLISSVNATN